MKFFYVDEVSKSGVYRMFTVAYEHNRDTGATSYGASVFRRDRANEMFIKAKHRMTASSRLELRPVSFNVKSEHPRDVELAIREKIRVDGVKGPRE